MGKGEVKPSALAKFKAQQKQSILQKTKKASNAIKKIEAPPSVPAVIPEVTL